MKMIFSPSTPGLGLGVRVGCDAVESGLSLQLGLGQG